MHNHNNSHDKSMMWMMVICCALPITILLLGGTAGTVLAGNSRWLIFGGLGVILLVHFLMMRKGHCCSGHSGKHEEHSTESTGMDMKHDEKQ